MKKLILLLILIISCHTLSFAQAKRDSILTNSRGMYTCNGKNLNRDDLHRILERDPQAKAQLKGAMGDFYLSLILAGGGGGLIGSQLGSAITGKPVQWAIIGAGVGFVALSIPISSAYIHKQRRAVRTYNEDIGKTTFRYAPIQYSLSFTGNQLGLVMRF